MKKEEYVSNCCQAVISEDGFCMDCKEQCVPELSVDSKEDIIKEHFSALGKKGMESRWKDKSKEERSAIMSAVRKKGMENKRKALKEETIN